MLSFNAQPNSSVLSGMWDNMDLIGNRIDQTNHSSKLATPVHGATPIFDNSRKQDPRSEGNSNSQKQDAEMQVPSEMESALLQQVLSLTPEQLSSLPPERQQEVIQLQQMLRQAS
ncbi:cleavage stimulating factor 64 isoform X2 [Olea europaea subsp. europaea]|uniref:Cleavage stimulating factor 64 isoform X2 n=1 Tax=Olea europaea subsp. europaea TaxID=158383 RepID=A0A8S0VE68_OLEEU|nr:cleavage stimulating factor 64 isoform X2 [Olea europaea subsp. europaea]